MELRTAKDRAMVPQILEKDELRQKELGISAGLPALTCRCTQNTNIGMASVPTQSRTMLHGSRTRSMSPLITLFHVF